MGPSPSHAPPSPGCGAAAGPLSGSPIAAKAPPLLLPAHPRAPEPLLRPAVYGPVPVPVLVPVRVRSCLAATPTPSSPSFPSEIGVRASTPGLWGDNSEHLRSGGRVPGGRSGSRSGRWSELGPAEPGAAQAGWSCRSSRRGAGPAPARAVWGQVAQRTGRGDTGRAARPERGEKRGWAGCTLCPPLLTAASPRSGTSGEPRAGGPELTRAAPAAGETPGRPVPAGERGKRRVFPWLRVAALRGAPVSCVSPSPIGDERREIKVDPRGWQWASGGRGGDGMGGEGSPLAAGALPGVQAAGHRQALPARYPRGCLAPGPLPSRHSRPAAGRGEHKGRWALAPRCAQAPWSRLCGQSSRPDPREGAAARPRSWQRPRHRTRPVPVPPTRAVPRWDSVAFSFSFRRNKLEPRSRVPAARVVPRGCPAADTVLWWESGGLF